MSCNKGNTVSSNPDVTKIEDIHRFEVKCPHLKQVNNNLKKELMTIRYTKHSATVITKKVIANITYHEAYWFASSIRRLMMSQAGCKKS